MKFFKLGVIIALLSMLLMIISCGDSSKDKVTTDKYGYERPTNCFMSHTLVLSEEPDVDSLFGNGGSTGILSDLAIESNCSEVSRSQTNYLVCLVYASSNETSISVDDMEISIDFAMATESLGVLFNESCVSYYEPYFYDGGFYDGVAFMDYIVVPFQILDDGMLYADLRVECPKLSPYDTYKVESFNSVRVGENQVKENPVVIDNINVNYLSEEKYNSGNFANEDLLSYANFTDGAPNYMVMDFDITANVNSDGNIDVMTYVPNSYQLHLNVEDAPTSKINTETNIYGATVLTASFNTLPDETGKKSIRMILRLDPMAAEECTINIIIAGDQVTSISGVGYKSQKLQLDIPAVKYTLDENGDYYTVSSVWKQEATDIVIPDNYLDIPVRYIASGIFQGNNSLQSIVIGNNVLSLPKETFRNCYQLKSVKIGSGITALSEQLFIGCDALESVTIPDAVTEIPESCFQGCSSLKRITLPAGVTVLRFNSFKNCTSLESITLPQSLQIIERNSFLNCSSLVSVEVNVASDMPFYIGDGAFNDCESLQKVTILGKWYVADYSNIGGLGTEELDITSHQQAATFLKDTYTKKCMVSSTYYENHVN